MSNENVEGMVTNTVNILRDNLHDRYDSGYPILKELIQNANDSGATKLIITKSNGLIDANHPLLNKKALLVYNDGYVSDKDLKGLKSVAQGGKSGREGVIGKFGLGMKSIFHFSDMFFYIAYTDEKVVIKSVNPYFDISTQRDEYHENWDDFNEIDSNFLKEAATNILKEELGYTSAPSSGLLLWIPLRDNTYENHILNDCYDVNNIWRLNSSELKKKIALSLISLDISTPCNGSSCSLRDIIVYNNSEKIHLTFNKIDKVIKDNKIDYCHYINKNCITSSKGEELLKDLLNRGVFSSTEIFDDNGNSKIETGYNNDQKTSLAIVKFDNSEKKSLTFNWISYLPLDSNADIELQDEQHLDGEYNLLLHGHFAIDSGRKSIVGFDAAVSNIDEIDIDSINDDKSAQAAWNAILIRYYLLPKVLEFACSENDEFINTLFSLLLTNKKYSDMGIFCLGSGFLYKEVIKNKIKWNYKQTDSIKDTVLDLINRSNEYYKDFENIKDYNYYNTIISILDYINTKATGLSFVVYKSYTNSAKNLLSDDLINSISKLSAEQYLPFIILPKGTEIDNVATKFTISDKNIVIRYLKAIHEANLGDNILGNVFYLLNFWDCIDSTIQKEIFTDPEINNTLPLFKLGNVNKVGGSYTYEYKTYSEIKDISNNKLLFNGYGVTEKNNALQLYAKIFDPLKIYFIEQNVATKQLLLKDTKETSNKIKYESDDIVVYDKDSIQSILDSMQEHLNNIDGVKDTTALSRFIGTIQNNLTDGILKNYKKLLKSILIGFDIDNFISLYKIHAPSVNEVKKINTYIRILKDYTNSLINNHVINTGISVPTELYDILDISEKNCDDLEMELKQNSLGIKKCSDVDKLELARIINNIDVYKSLPIHQTLENTFVSVDEFTYVEDTLLTLPDDYSLNLKILKKNLNEPLQSYVPTVKTINIVNAILCDTNINLETPQSLRIRNYLHDCFKNGNFTKEELYPNAKTKRWIEGNNYNFYSLNEIINDNRVTMEFLSQCNNLTLLQSLNDENKIPAVYLEDDESLVLKKIISSHDDTWPWFNLTKYQLLNSEINNNYALILQLIEKTEDPLVQLLINFKGQGNAGSILSYYNTELNDFYYISNENKINKNILKYILNICSDINEGDEAENYLINHLHELFIKLGSTDEFIDIATSNDNICLPNENNVWQKVSTLVNVSSEIQDLREENKLHHLLSEDFKSENTRTSTENFRIISTENLINIISKLKNKQLWGVFCYFCLCLNERGALKESAELLDYDTYRILNTKILKKERVNSTTIQIFNLDGNFCTSLTGKKISLSSNINKKSVFYNEPCINDGNLTLQLYDNFNNFNANEIQTAIQKIIKNIYKLEDFSDEFYNRLQKPDQVRIEEAINTIFSNIFYTLKFLKLNIIAGRYNKIADLWLAYQKAVGKRDIESQRKALDNIQNLIQINDDNIQQEIRDKVIAFVKRAEYQEECILFEIFQNADDAYSQNKYKSKVPYFTVIKNNGTLILEHCGRPINQYRVGTPVSYKSDLINMLQIGWSDKDSLQTTGEQTGKYGYGFKTVYLVCDEPHIRSGEYDFIVKGALYPEPIIDRSGFTDKTIIELPLNNHGISMCDKLVSSFANVAKYQVMFSKKIKKITVKNVTYTWNPVDQNIFNIFNSTIEICNNFILFTIKDTSNVELARIAFKMENDEVVPFEDETYKIWNMAPLHDFMNMGFAISANFKTNTGRQTLARNFSNNIDDEDHKLIGKISTCFTDILLKIMDDKSFVRLRKYIPSIVNVLFIGTMKTDFIELLPTKVLSAFITRGFIPDGYKTLHEYKDCKVYAFSASDFNDKKSTQNKIISQMNQLITNCTPNKILIVSELVAKTIRANQYEYKRVQVIDIVDKLLKLNQNIEVQKNILLYLSNSDIYKYLINKHMMLSNCNLFDRDGVSTPVIRISSLSDGYGEAKPLLSNLVKLSLETIENLHQFNSTLTNDSYFEEQTEYEQVYDNNYDDSYSSYNKFEDVFESWLKDYNSNSWDSKVDEYYSNLYPQQLKRQNLKEQLTLSVAELKNFTNANKMPEKWCIFLLMAMCQNITAWGHTASSNKNAIEWLYDKNIISSFCNGMDLEVLYDIYLDNQESEEKYLRQFETLLRLYKLRKNFKDFYMHIKQLELAPNLDSVEKILDISINSELSGSGREIPSCVKSLGFGIHIIIRELLLSGFYNKNVLYKFAYTPRSTTCYQLSNCNNLSEAQRMPSVSIYERIIEKLDNINSSNNDKSIFISNFDLPLIIYARND